MLTYKNKVVFIIGPKGYDERLLDLQWSSHQMQFYNKQTETSPVFSPACMSGLCRRTWMSRWQSVNFAICEWLNFLSFSRIVVHCANLCMIDCGNKQRVLTPGHQGYMPCTVYVALLWNIIYWKCIWNSLFVTSLWPNLTLLCNITGRSINIDD